MKIKNFLFHRVSPERDPLWDPISPEKFEKIISFITTRYKVVKLEDFILNKDIASAKDKPLATIVFDDGYKDFLLYALPILNKYKCPCSMYVVTNCVEYQTPPWTYVLDYHLLNSRKLKLDIHTDLLPENLRTTSFDNNEKRILFARKLKPFLKTTNNNIRIQLFDQVVKSLNDVDVGSHLMLNWEELGILKQNGIEIGSHSTSHPLLAKIDQQENIREELSISGKTIEQKLGHFPLAISYPIGSYNMEVKQLSAECGYKLGLAVNQTTYDSIEHDNFEIPRIELYNESFFKTRFRINGIIQKLNKIRK